ncbi:MAG: LPS export ABC transporter periplasmic protein LptC [Alphaproteobacteria bacterium]|nr:LPS export ABC transporter periplasmic protein LptC [Alphaproteobacteria bacterium]
MPLREDAIGIGRNGAGQSAAGGSAVAPALHLAAVRDTPPPGAAAQPAAPSASGTAADSERPRRRAALFYADGALRRRIANPAFLARRRRFVWLLKRVLPVLALLTLAAIALWPQLRGNEDRLRFSIARPATAPGAMTSTPDAARLTNARYAGVDGQNRPFVITADVAQQGLGDERITLSNPHGEIVLNDGRTVTLESVHGVYRQQSGLLDLSGDVTLRHAAGYVIRSEEAAVDLKAGTAGGDQPVSLRSAAATVDAQGGFRLVQRGQVILFLGPARAVISPGAASAAQPAPTAPVAGAGR